MTDQLLIMQVMAAVAVLLFAIVGDIARVEGARHLAFAGLFGNGFLYSLTQVQSGHGGIAWSIAAVIAAVACATMLERFTGTTVKEQRLWRQLFGNTVRQMLINDSRRHRNQ